MTTANGEENGVSTQNTDVKASQPETHIEQKPTDEDSRRQIEDKARSFLAKQTHRVIVPSFAAWFDRTKYHDIEKNSLPEFFNEKNRTKTPEIYNEYRIFMIDTYRLNPVEYLTVTACRRNLAGDVCALMRVHAFLEKWGLINYQIDPETRPSFIGPQFTGHFQIILDTPQGLQPYVPQDKKSVESSKTETEESTALTVRNNKQTEDHKKINGLANLSLRKNIYDSAADAIALHDESQRQITAINTRTYNCYTCGDDVTKIRYHNLRSKQAISALCFQNGLFPSNFNSADYVKIEQSQISASEWSDQEVLLLLEAIEMYEDDWNNIAYHVGTRNKESCIYKFLQLPIEDPYLVRNFHNSSAVEESNKINVSGKKENLEPNDEIFKALKEFLTRKDKEVKDIIVHNSEKLAETEKASLGNTVGSLVELELEKVKAKLAKFEAAEKALVQEKLAIENAREQLFVDRLSLKKQALLVNEKLQAALNAETPEEAAELSKAATTIANEKLRVELSSAPAASNPGSATVDDKDETVEVSDAFKPVSVETPQTFKLWSI